MQIGSNLVVSGLPAVVVVCPGLAQSRGRAPKQMHVCFSSLHQVFKKLLTVYETVSRGYSLIKTCGDVLL